MRNQLAYLIIVLIFTLHASAQSSKSLDDMVSDNNQSAETLIQEGKLAEADYKDRWFVLPRNYNVVSERAEDKKEDIEGVSTRTGEAGSRKRTFELILPKVIFSSTEKENKKTSCSI